MMEYLLACQKKKKYNYKIIIVVLHDFLDRLFPPIVRHARKKFPSSSKLSVSPSRKERKIRAELVSIQRRTRRRNSNLTKAFTSLPRASTHHHPPPSDELMGKFSTVSLSMDAAAFSVSPNFDYSQLCPIDPSRRSIDIN